MGSKVRKILIGVSIAIVVVVLGSVIYLNSLYNLMDRSEQTGDPTIAESDLAAPEDFDPIATTESGDTTEPSESIDPDSDETLEPGDGTDETTDSSINPSESATTKPTLSLQQMYPLKTSSDVYNILLIGSDSRDSSFTGRSDSMMILSVNKKTKKIHLVSLTRAMYVAIDGHGRSMLNNAYSWGGSKLLLKTIRDNLRVQIDDYVVINFVGFSRAIDIVGGIDVSLTQAEIDYLHQTYPGAELKVGTNHLDGDLALLYARIRKIDSDYRRSARQRTVISALINQLESSSAGQIDALVRELLPLVKSNLSRTSMISLAVNALQYKSYPIKQLMLPITGTFKTIVVRGMQMTQYDEGKNIKELQRFLYQD